MHVYDFTVSEVQKCEHCWPQHCCRVSQYLKLMPGLQSYLRLYQERCCFHFCVVIGSIVFWGLWGWGPFLTVCLFLQGQEGRISLENGYYNIIKNNHVYVNSYILSLLFFYQVSVSTLRKGGNYIKGWIPRGRDCGSHHKSVHAVNWPHLYFKLGSGGKVNQKDEESILSH
jgi:hypothetical protein